MILNGYWLSLNRRVLRLEESGVIDLLLAVHHPGSHCRAGSKPLRKTVPSLSFLLRLVRGIDKESFRKLFESNSHSRHNFIARMSFDFALEIGLISTLGLRNPQPIYIMIYG